MTEKQLLKKLTALSGVVKYPDCIIKLPQILHIKTKEQALDLLDIVNGSWDIEGESYQINHEPANITTCSCS